MGLQIYVPIANTVSLVELATGIIQTDQSYASVLRHFSSDGREEMVVL